MNWFLLLFNVVLLNIILSGDNALAISMAASKLPFVIRKKAIVLGSVVSILALIVFVIVGSYIIELPFLKSIAGLLLLWIAVHLVIEQKNSSGKVISGHKHVSNTLWKAILVISLADLSMELDNALAMVSVADGKISVLMAGFLITIPFLIFGSHFVSHLMHKFPWMIHIAATYITWIAGTMIASDKFIMTAPLHAVLRFMIPAICVLVFLSILFLHRMRFRKQAMSEHGQDITTPERGRAVQ